MLYALSQSTTPTQSAFLVTVYAIFSQPETLSLINGLARFSIIGERCFSREHNDAKAIRSREDNWQTFSCKPEFLSVKVHHRLLRY